MDTFNEEDVRVVYDTVGAFTAKIPMSLIARLTGTFLIGQDIHYYLEITADRDGYFQDFTIFPDSAHKFMMIPRHERDLLFKRICAYIHGRMHMALESITDPTRSCLTLTQPEVYNHFNHYVPPVPAPLPGVHNTESEVLDWFFVELVNMIYAFTPNNRAQIQIVEQIEEAASRVHQLRN